MNTREFDNIIKQKTQSRKAVVPPDIWEGIVQAKEKNRKPFGWLVLLVLLIICGIAYWIKDVVEDKSELSKNMNNNQQIKTLAINNTDSKNQSLLVSTILDDSIAIAKKKNSGNSLIRTNASTNAATNENGYTQAGDVASESNERYIKRKQKRNIKGKSNLTVLDGETDQAVESDDVHSVKDIDKLTLYNNSNKATSTVENILQMVIAGKLNDDKPDKDSITKVDADLVVKAIEPEIKNPAKPEMSMVKKDSTRQKIHGLAIEAGVIVAFPIQEYRQPLYVQRMLVTTKSNAAFKSNKKIITNIENGGGFAINLVKRINRKWSVGTGAGYLRFTESLEMQGTETLTQFTIVQRLKEGPFGPYLQPDTLSTTTTYNTTLYGRNIYNNISLPVFVRYRFNENRKISLELTTGFTVSFIRKYSNNMPGQFTTVYENGISKNGEKSSIGFDAFAGLLVKGKLFKQYGWFATSSLAYNFSAYNSNQLSFNKRIHMPSITAGFVRELKK